MTTPQIKVEPQEGFEFGNCAVSAIAIAFGWGYKPTRVAIQLCGVECPHLGMTYHEINRVLNKLCSLTGKEVTYIPNKAGVTAAQFGWCRPEGCSILHFSEHLTCLQGGVFKDAYYDAKDFLTIKPTGWWIIE